MNGNTTPSPTWEEEFDKIDYETEIGLVCLNCRTIFPKNTFGVDLRCPDCSDIVVTPMRAYKLNIKTFIQTQIEKAKAQGRAEALEEVIKYCSETCYAHIEDGSDFGTDCCKEDVIDYFKSNPQP